MNATIMTDETSIKQNLRLEHLNDEGRKSALDICLECNDIFHLAGNIVTYTKA